MSRPKSKAWLNSPTHRSDVGSGSFHSEIGFIRCSSQSQGKAGARVDSTNLVQPKFNVSLPVHVIVKTLMSGEKQYTLGLMKGRVITSSMQVWWSGGPLVINTRPIWRKAYGGSR